MMDEKNREKIIVNFTNHPSANWDVSQKEAAECYGRIVDISFPNVDPKGDEAYIEMLAMKSVEAIMKYEPEAVLCQGEFCLAYRVIQELKERGITVLAACSERLVRDNGNRKEVTFQFSRFRRY